jgi:hypothetical protein
MNAIDKSISSLFATAWKDENGNGYKSEVLFNLKGNCTELHQV